MKKQMKLMSLLVLFGFMMAPVFAQAQHGKTGKDHYGPEKHLEKMTEELQLTPEQVAAIKQVDSDFEAETKAVAEKMETAHAEMRALHQAKRQAVDQILTPEQLAKRKEMKEAKRPREDGKRPHPRGPRPDCPDKE
ncbi:MAG: hypothetical protein KDC34_09345 [Saprospiraceae bacterium]|nr:hypothetical protein [Saprospiraceae bacterium]